MTTPAPEPDPSQEDALWQEIVAHYGDRPELEPPDAEPPAAEVPGVSSYVVPAPQSPSQPLPAPYDDDHYVPPPPPPVVYPTGVRALAWFGLFGGPVVLLLLMVLRIYVASWFNWLVFFGFVGGFGYLVATLPRGNDGSNDGWDDRSRI